MKVRYVLALVLAVIGLFGTSLVAFADGDDEVDVVAGGVVIGESELERDDDGVRGEIELDLTKHINLLKVKK